MNVERYLGLKSSEVEKRKTWNYSFEILEWNIMNQSGGLTANPCE
jgi:hypothetical protein